MPDPTATPPSVIDNGDAGAEAVPSELDGQRRPIVRHIQESLRERIRAGELVPGDKLPSMRRLSEEFSCSLGMVKQAVNTLAAQGVLRSAPRRGVFVASTRPTEREIVLILPHLEIQRLHLAVVGVRQAIGDRDLRISIHATAGPTGGEPGMPEYLTSSQVAGALVLLPSGDEHDMLLPMLSGRGVPTAVVDVTPRDRGIDVISIDPVAVGRKSAGELIERGHRRLMLIEPIGDSRVPADVDVGVHEAIRAAGLEPNAVLERVAVDRTGLGGDPTWLRGKQQAAAALARDPSITAVLGMGPQLTLGACLALRDAGRSIPMDTSVIGLLGDSSALQSHEPPITIYDNPLKEICMRAAQRLLARVEGLDAAPETVRCDPLLIDRGSVGPPPTR